jgi:SAM-dependent methyltransferase
MDWLGNYLYRWRIRTVLPHVSGALLDLACGTNELIKAYGSGVGVDRYPSGEVDVAIEDAARLPFDDNTFDTVTILAALNHIPNRAEALGEVYRVLKPNGTLVVTMIPPWTSRIWHRVRGEADRDQAERDWAPGEVYGLTRSSTRQLLMNAGFRDVRQHGFMFGINTLTLSVK